LRASILVVLAIDEITTEMIITNASCDRTKVMQIWKEKSKYGPIYSTCIHVISSLCYQMEALFYISKNELHLVQCQNLMKLYLMKYLSSANFSSTKTSLFRTILYRDRDHPDRSGSLKTHPDCRQSAYILYKLTFEIDLLCSISSNAEKEIIRVFILQPTYTR